MDSIKKISVVDAVMEQILSCVRLGQFVEGERIPSERELTTMLQVSRTALREAIKRLQSMGILTVRHGDGTYLESCARQNELLFREKLKTLFELGEVGIQDFVHARLMLENNAVRLAVERADEEDFDRLEVINKKALENISKPNVFAQCDINFHQTLCEISRNPVLIRFTLSIMDLLTEQIHRSIFNHCNLAQPFRHHQQIIDALRTRNTRLALKSVENHLKRITTQLALAVEQKP